MRTWTSFPNGSIDTGALNVEFDVYATTFATPLGDAALKIWGVGLQDVISPDFNGMQIDLYGGMGKGLPLANAAQQGLLVSGTVWQAFGNWQGTDMSLDFIIKPLDTSASKPANIVFQWKAGVQLSSALAATLTTAYPAYKQQININPNLVLAHDEAHYCPTMTSLAQFLEGVTINLFGTTYQGVQITLRENTFIAFDGSTPATPTTLLFTDLVGQPTWYAPQMISVATVMRADLQVGGYIQMPIGYVAGAGSIVTQASSLSQYANKSAFQGAFQILQARHIGNFRDPDGRSWVSIFNCALPATP